MFNCTFKKGLVATLMVVVAGMFVACGGAKKNTDATSDEKSGTIKIQEEVVADCIKVMKQKCGFRVVENELDGYKYCYIECEVKTENLKEIEGGNPRLTMYLLDEDGVELMWIVSDINGDEKIKGKKQKLRFGSTGKYEDNNKEWFEETISQTKNVSFSFKKDWIWDR